MRREPRHAAHAGSVRKARRVAAEGVAVARQVLRKAPTSRTSLDLPELAAASGLLQKDLIQSIKNMQQVLARRPHAPRPAPRANSRTPPPPHLHTPSPSATATSTPPPARAAAAGTSAAEIHTLLLLVSFGAGVGGVRLAGWRPGGRVYGETRGVTAGCVPCLCMPLTRGQ